MGYTEKADGGTTVAREPVVKTVVKRGTRRDSVGTELLGDRGRSFNRKFDSAKYMRKQESI